MQARLAALGGALALAAIVALVSFSSTAQADSPHPGLNFWLEAVGQDCDSSAGDAVCKIDPGTTFTLNVNLDPLPTDIPSYVGFDAVLLYTGLTSVDNVSLSDNPSDPNDWPECEFPAVVYEPGVVAFACALGIQFTESTYDGVLAFMDFVACEQSCTIRLAHGPGNTVLAEQTSISHDEGAGTFDTLNINFPEPTATPTGGPASATPTSTTTAAGVVPTALPPTGLGDAADDNGSANLWTIIAVLTTIAVAGMGAGAWRIVRR